MDKRVSPHAEFPLANTDKIGNLIIYLADKLSQVNRDLYLIRLLRLMYSIDETAVRETGVPVTGLKYKVWKMGPVADVLYAEFGCSETNYFGSFVRGTSRHVSDLNAVVITPVASFNASGFSEYEINLADRVFAKVGHIDGRKLFMLLQEEGGPWARVVQDNSLDWSKGSTSNHDVDLACVVAKDGFESEECRHSWESLSLYASDKTVRFQNNCTS